MYLSHWGLRETPFRNGRNRRAFYHGPAQDEALARLHFLVDGRRRLGWVVGDAGVGKSFLLDIFADEGRRAGHCVARFSLQGLSAHEFLWELAGGLGAVPERGATAFDLWRSATDRIVANRYQQIATVLLFDDADQSLPDVVDYLLRLTQLEPSAESRLTLVLAGRADRLRQVHPRLLDLAELRVELPVWDASDTTGYVRQALARVGGDEELFDPTALARLHDLSGGTPRRLNQLADLALLAGAGEGLNHIDAATIDAVDEELSLHSPAASVPSRRSGQ